MKYYVIAVKFDESDKIHYWEKGGGYTDDISKAEVYTEEAKERNSRYITFGLYFVELPDVSEAV